MVYSKLVSSLIALVAILFVSFFVRDWYVLHECGAVQSCLDSASDFQNITKFIVTCVATLLAFTTGRRLVTKRDRFFLQMTFLMILCADFCFKILYNYFGTIDTRDNFITLGIGFFFMAQIILIYRHTRVSDDDWSFPWIYCVPLAAVIAMIVLAQLHVLESYVLMAVLAYIPVLLCSLVVACMTLKFKFFPKANANLIVLGMVCFTCCDALTGLSLLSGADHSTIEVFAAVSNNFIWLFYVPAIIFLALSGYRRNV